MAIIKIIIVVIGLTVLTVCACKTTVSSFNQTDKSQANTTYVTTTQQLRSGLIPDSIFRMGNLKLLSIQGMDCDYGDQSECWMIGEIPPQIKKLKNLETLRLNVNSISTIPVELTELKKLKQIDLSDNVSLSNIDALVKISSIEELYLYGCHLTKMPSDIGNLKNLRKAGIVGNNLDKNEQNRIKKALPNCDIIF